MADAPRPFPDLDSGEIHPTTEQEDEAPGRHRALAAIAGSQLLALTLWLSASAVAPQLQELWELSSAQTAALTLAVQIGFVVGALASAVLSIADVVPSRRLFVLSGIGGFSCECWVGGPRSWRFQRSRLSAIPHRSPPSPASTRAGSRSCPVGSVGGEGWRSACWWAH